MKTILVINRPQDYKQKKILVYYHVDQREMHRIAEKHQKDIIIKWLK